MANKSLQHCLVRRAPYLAARVGARRLTMQLRLLLGRLMTPEFPRPEIRGPAPPTGAIELLRTGGMAWMERRPSAPFDLGTPAVARSPW